MYINSTSCSLTVFAFGFLLLKGLFGDYILKVV